MRGFRFVVCVTIFFIFVVISSFCKHWNTVCSRCVCESRTTDWNVSECAHESDWKSTVSNEISRNDRWNCGTRVANELITIWTTARDKFNAALYRYGSMQMILPKTAESLPFFFKLEMPLWNSKCGKNRVFQDLSVYLSVFFVYHFVSLDLWAYAFHIRFERLIVIFSFHKLLLHSLDTNY